MVTELEEVPDVDRRRVGHPPEAVDVRLRRARRRAGGNGAGSPRPTGSIWPDWLTRFDRRRRRGVRDGRLHRLAVRRRGDAQGRRGRAPGRAGRHRRAARAEAAGQDRPGRREASAGAARPPAGCRSATSRRRRCWSGGPLLELYQRPARPAHRLGAARPRGLFPPGRHRARAGRGGPRRPGTGCKRIVDEQLSSVGRLQVNTALTVMDTLAEHLDRLRRRLLATARHVHGARALMHDIYGVGRMTSLALVRLARRRRPVLAPPARRSGSSAWTSPCTPPTANAAPAGCPGKARKCCGGCCSRRPRPPPAPAHPATTTTPRSRNATTRNRACLSQARRIVRHATHILTDLGDDAFTIVAQPAAPTHHRPLTT